MSTQKDIKRDPRPWLYSLDESDVRRIARDNNIEEHTYDEDSFIDLIEDLAEEMESTQ